MTIRYQHAVLALLAVITLGTSCTTRKTITYLQDVELAQQYAVAYDRETKLQVGDRIKVKVNSTFLELAAPFNGAGYVMPGQQGGGGAAVSSQAPQIGYTVKRDGTIDFPVLGRIKVVGMTTAAVSELLRERILLGKYMKDPDVHVVLDNFTIFLLGAVSEQLGAAGSRDYLGGGQQGGDYAFTAFNAAGGGVLRVRERDKINILEAIAMVGDLPVQAKIDRINVIRKENDKYTTYRVNLKSASLFASPAFYLKQNDIIYVEHRYKGERSLDRGLQLGSYFFSALSTITVALALFVNKK
ncbi:polysaccharide biosynthesis/export family protein [Porphyromonas sp. COT-239 OH1446]|uniref:polysaccharide biosynthesis/export family protein n=1 Tax=Porphyromonas sp. COT-239 OH1446 TaxID=1515613 RepID=UPI00052DDD79|nr:polysaccharide biosynthesis/export family protein [Porphyromonas sp. COT-239 OH1446]KGN67666.1 hypothetical protein HQ37_07425 [Porphyromonas sp. COT-239 OH1446]